MILRDRGGLGDGQLLLWRLRQHDRRIEIDHVCVNESVRTKGDCGACDGVVQLGTEAGPMGLDSLLVEVDGHIELRSGIEEVLEAI